MKNKVSNPSVSEAIIEFLHANWLLILGVVFIIWMIKAYLYRKSYERTYCKAYTCRGDEQKGEKEKFLNHVEVRRFKKNNKYKYHDPNGTWYPLPKSRIKQIELSRLSNGPPEFDLPKRPNNT